MLLLSSSEVRNGYHHFYCSLFIQESGLSYHSVADVENLLKITPREHRKKERFLMILHEGSDIKKKETALEEVDGRWMG